MKIAADIIALIILEVLKGINRQGQQVTDVDLVLEPFKATEERVHQKLKDLGYEIEP